MQHLFRILGAIAIALVASCGGGGSSAPSVTSPVLAPPDPEGVAFSGPITITRGGTYTGNWQSLDPLVPTVRITTTEPVVIERSVIRGAGHLIHGFGLTLTVRDTRAYALNPNTSERVPGRFVAGEEFHDIAILNNDVSGTSGIYLREFVGNAASGQTIKVLRNRIRNIDGRKSDGRGGWSTDRFEFAQFVQLNGVIGVPGIEIAWNEVVNEPNQGRVEDNISIYKSSGTPESPIDIHDNYVEGAYAYPASGGYSGGGIMLGDGTGEKITDVPGHVVAHDNQVVSTGNYGLAITSGHDLLIRDNRVVSSGRLADGTIYTMDYGNGLNVWDSTRDASRGLFFNNSARDNTVGLLRPNGGVLRRSDFWFPDCGSLCTGNVSLPDPIDHALEAAERARWQQKVQAAGVAIGRRP